jgi:hypothetical protein
MHTAFLADLIVVIHLLYVGFTVGGEALILFGTFLRWRWIRNMTFRVIHVAACAFVAVEALVGVLCPLTEWEYSLRIMAGQRLERDLTFIARLVHSVIFYDFPSWVFLVCYIAFGGFVILTFVLIPPAQGGVLPQKEVAPSKQRSAKK